MRKLVVALALFAVVPAHADALTLLCSGTKLETPIKGRKGQGYVVIDPLAKSVNVEGIGQLRISSTKYDATLIYFDDEDDINKTTAVQGFVELLGGHLWIERKSPVVEVWDMYCHSN
jgi:hypothetical protein